MNFSVLDGAAPWSSPLRQGGRVEPGSNNFSPPLRPHKSQSEQSRASSAKPSRLPIFPAGQRSGHMRPFCQKHPPSPHLPGPPLKNCRQCETKNVSERSETYKITTQLHPQRRILGKVMPLAPLLKSRVCHKLASPIMAWVPPSSCTSRIPKQHSLDPPVRGQIRNMHRKFPVMFAALLRPSVQSVLLCECQCLFIPMMQNIMPRSVPFHEIWRPDGHT